jgi:hypothetical protein
LLCVLQLWFRLLPIKSKLAHYRFLQISGSLGRLWWALQWGDADA